jgi:TRAP-type C4-dicarboxylate transport system permease small subunit
VDSIGQAVLNFVQIFSYVVILLAVLAIIYVGFQYILASASGNATKIKELHTYLLYIVIGIAVVIGAQVIVRVVLNTLQATGTVNSNIIQGANKALQTR